VAGGGGERQDAAGDAAEAGEGDRALQHGPQCGARGVRPADGDREAGHAGGLHRRNRLQQSLPVPHEVRSGLLRNVYLPSH